MLEFYFKINKLNVIDKPIYVKLEYTSLNYKIDYYILKKIYINMLSKQLICNKQDIISISKKEYLSTI